MNPLLTLVSAALQSPSGTLRPLDGSHVLEDEHLFSEPGAMRDAAYFPLSAFPRAQRLSLRAALTSDVTPKTAIQIRATADPPVAGTLTQTIGPALMTVQPIEWNGGSSTVDVDVDVRHLCDGGVGQHRVVLRWQYKVGGSAPVDLGVSEHLVFITLEPPQDPWTSVADPAGVRALPWAGILALACEWARGATTSAEAAAAIARNMFALGWVAASPTPDKPLRYSRDRPTYLGGGMARPQWFEWSAFLTDLHAPKRTFPMELSCVATSAVVVTVANLLGCVLTPVLIDASGCDQFDVRLLKRLGRPVDATRSTFLFHLVPSIVPSSSQLADATVFEPAFLVKPPNKTAFSQPVEMQLGPGKGSYLPALVDPADLAACTLKADRRPRVLKPLHQRQVDPCTLVRYARYMQELQPLDVWHGELPTTLRMVGFNPQVRITIPNPERPQWLPRVPTQTRTLFRVSSLQDLPVIQSDFWSDRDPEVTLQYFAELLACLSERPVRQEMAGGIGYAIPGGDSLFLLIPGAAARLSKVSDYPVDLVSVFREATPA